VAASAVRTSRAPIKVRATLLISATFRIKICRSARQDVRHFRSCWTDCQRAGSGEAHRFFDHENLGTRECSLSLPSDLVDHRKLKVYSDMVFKADKLAAEETGQLPQRVDGLDSRYTAPVLGLGNGTIDYAKAGQRRREWEAAAPEREAAARERDAVREAEMESLKQRMLVAAGVDKQGRDQRIFENWLAREEQRLAQGLGLEEEWDVDDFAAVRADVERYFPGNEVMRDRVERFIATASRKPETNEGEGEVQEL
jgi:hypothetical protein